MNVSEGFQLRTAYKKKVKPSKLDGLLERRVKQFTLEEKQRLERIRQAALLSKTSGAKPPKTEGSALGKQQPAATPCVKTETAEDPEVKDHVVKKLNFEQEETKMNADVDVKSETSALDHSKPTEENAAQENCGDAVARKEVNGGLLSSTEPHGKNYCVSDAMETKDKKPEVAQVGENAKKRGYEEMEQGCAASVEVQVNGEAEVAAAPADSSAIADPVGQEHGDVKEPVKSLMNGNLPQNDAPDICHPPPPKVPKFENHVAEKGDTLSQDVAVGSDPAKLPSSSSLRLNTNSGDSNGAREGVKAPAETTATEPQKAPTADLPSKTEVTPPVSSVTSSSSRAFGHQRNKLPLAVTKTTSTSSMTISKEYSTKDRISLLRFSKSRKARSGTALPSYRKFVTKSSKKSIFILPNDDLKRMARRAGIREVPIFNYTAKPALDIWPYPSPRPTFGITWRFVTP